MLDHFDHRIIKALTDNARTLTTELSPLVNLSRNAITYRIKKLETSGIIKHYATILDNEFADD